MADGRSRRLSVTTETRQPAVGATAGTPRRPLLGGARSFSLARAPAAEAGGSPTHGTAPVARPRVPLAGTTFQNRTGVTTHSSLTSAQCESTFEVEGVRVRFAALTQPGTEPGGHLKANQDSYTVHEKLAGQATCAMLGVFDGHGAFGTRVSQHIAQCLPLSIGQTAAFRSGDLEEACRLAFPEVNRTLQARRDIDCEMSGSTCVVSFLTHARKLLTANVGDSRSILGSVDLRGTVTATDLNVEHKPTVASEAERVVSSGGRIEPYVFQGQHVGPPRVWLLGEDAPGLCMTRAFGDQLAATVGVTCEPEFIAHTLKPSDKYLIICSDGITEFIESSEIVRLVHNAAGPRFGPKEACQMLMTEARRRWAREEEDVVDDCTVIVGFLSVT